jgi:hypothetical protein
MEDVPVSRVVNECRVSLLLPGEKRAACNFLAVGMAHLPAVESLVSVEIKTPVVFPSSTNRDVEKGNIGVALNSEDDHYRVFYMDIGLPKRSN